MKKEKVVLAFSGGLDTSFCVKYLSEEKGYEVHTAIANTGGFSPAELKVIEQKALALGAASHVTLDIEQEYYEKSIKYMVFGNILRNGAWRAKMHHNGAFDVTFLHHRRPPSVPCLLVVHQALSDSSLALAASSSPASCS